MARTTTTTLRRCIGSARFGIEPHEAPVADFPKQPSQKDGLGRMCADPLEAYVKGLRGGPQGQATGSEPTDAGRQGRPREGDHEARAAADADGAPA